MFKKYISESVGTGVLVFMGCGTAMLVGCDPSGSGYLMTALAFGLSIVAMAYSVGNISGGHFNAAVTLAVLMRKKITTREAVMYWIFQLIGAFLERNVIQNKLIGRACLFIPVRIIRRKTKVFFFIEHVNHFHSNVHLPSFYRSSCPKVFPAFLFILPYPTKTTVR